MYQHTSAYNQFDQSLGLNALFSLSPNMTLSVQEGFFRTSNVFNQPNPQPGTSVSGSVPVPRAALIIPVADQINNGTSGQYTYQTSANGMLGGNANFNTLYYPNASVGSGIYNSRSSGASLFFSYRLGDRYYAGGTYQFQDVLSSEGSTSNQLSPSQTRMQTQTIFGFVSIYLKPTLSLSISAGPQHYSAVQMPLPSSQSWTPMTMVSLGWQGERTTLGLSYSQNRDGWWRAERSFPL